MSGRMTVLPVTLACDAAGGVVARVLVALWSAITMSNVSSNAHRRVTSAVSAEVSDAAAVGGGKVAGLIGGATGNAALGDAAIFCLARGGGEAESASFL